jgi:CheY-like chemotaxis protein
VYTQGKPQRIVSRRREGEKDGAPPRPRVLVIEDDPDTRLLLHRVLEPRCRVTALARPGPLRRSAARYDLAILDLELYGSSGEAAAGLLRRRADPPPILVASGHARAEERAVALGAAGCLAKPFTVDDLHRAVVRTLRPEARHAVRFDPAAGADWEGVAAFLGENLEQGGSAMAVVTGPHWKRIVPELELRGVAVGRALRRGRLRHLDAAAVLPGLLVNGMPDAGRFARRIESVVRDLCARAGGAGLRVFGEGVGLLALEGRFEAARRLEELWAPVIRSHPVSLW